MSLKKYGQSGIERGLKYYNYKNMIENTKQQESVADRIVREAVKKDDEALVRGFFLWSMFNFPEFVPFLAVMLVEAADKGVLYTIVEKTGGQQETFNAAFQEQGEKARNGLERFVQELERLAGKNDKSK